VSPHKKYAFLNPVLTLVASSYHRGYDVSRNFWQKFLAALVGRGTAIGTRPTGPAEPLLLAS